MQHLQKLISVAIKPPITRIYWVGISWFDTQKITPCSPILLRHQLHITYLRIDWDNSLHISCTRNSDGESLFWPMI